MAACGLKGAAAAQACSRLFGPTWGLGVDLYFLSCPESVGLQTVPQGPCAQIVYTLALKQSLYRYFGAKVYTIWVHGP